MSLSWKLGMILPVRPFFAGCSDTSDRWGGHMDRTDCIYLEGRENEVKNMATNSSANSAAGPGVLLKTLMLSYVVTVVLMFGLAFVLYKMKLNSSQAAWGVMLIYFLSCALGGFIAGKKMGSRRLLWGIASGLIYFAVLFILSLAVGSGLRGDMQGILTALAACLGGGAVGAFLS